MCDMLGTEPIEEEIPIELSDFSEDLQLIFELYSMLPDVWEGFNGQYMGKDTSNIFNFFNLYNIDPLDYLIYLRILKYMDRVRMDIISQRLKAKQSMEKNSKKPA